jgi:hypothetical protein
VKVLEQIVEGHGQSEADPLTGLGIEGFYVLARSCAATVVGQRATLGETRILDCMRVAHED